MRHTAVLMLVGALALGCASGGRKVTEVREERVDPVTGRVIATQETTTRETEAKDYCDGVLSCTLDVTGTILAFPFRLIGGVLELLF